jgi:hypothetical protein
MSKTWNDLNPAEPTPLYLVKFMVVVLTLFVVAYFIGQS